MFKAKSPIKRDEYQWLMACFAWLRVHLDDGDFEPQLILPDNVKLQEASTAPELFAAVRSLAGMDNFPCRLEKVEVAHHDSKFVVHEGVSACGTFSVENGEAVIRYSSDMLRDPDALAATFAHELCHYLLLDAGDPPGGPDLMEHSTDCAAAYLGFGVLLANSARNFSQWNDGALQGWQSSTAGYLSEQALVTATAMFGALYQVDLDVAEGQVKPYLRSDLRKARKAVTRDFPDFANSLSEVDLSQWVFS